MAKRKVKDKQTPQRQEQPPAEKQAADRPEADGKKRVAPPEPPAA